MNISHKIVILECLKQIKETKKNGDVLRMGRLIELGRRQNELPEEYYKLFNEYKAKEFSDTLTPQEKVEYDRIYKIILHN